VLVSQPVALLKWFLENQPEVLEQTKWVFGVKDSARYCMTDEPFVENTDISSSSLVNLNTASFDDEILNLFGLESIKEKLPPLTYSSQFCGKVTMEWAAANGLMEGTPVAAGLFDIDACAIGMPKACRLRRPAKRWLLPLRKRASTADLGPQSVKRYALGRPGAVLRSV
jgi:L-xylulokinase